MLRDRSRSNWYGMVKFPPCASPTRGRASSCARPSPTTSWPRAGAACSSRRPSAPRCAGERDAPGAPQRTLDRAGTVKTILELSTELREEQTTSRVLVEQALERIDDPSGEGKRTFTIVYREAALAQANAVDELRANGIELSPLAGLPVSIKDLFDVAGETTTAGSRVLQGAPPADHDAPVVARLRAAGAVIVGKTNMTEFAFAAV